MSQKSSQKRIEANRRNAQKSTGPRTDQGKAKSALNSTTHGFSSFDGPPLSPRSFLAIEDQSRFEAMLARYVDTYRPQHPDEHDLLTEAVYAKWRQQRIWIAETAQIEVAIAQNEIELRRQLPPANAAAHLANGFAKSEAMIKLYLRYDAQLHRHYRNCLKDLKDLQDSRAQNITAPIEPIHPDPEPAAEPIPPTPEPATPDEPNPITPEAARQLAIQAEIRHLMDVNLGRIPQPPR